MPGWTSPAACGDNAAAQSFSAPMKVLFDIFPILLFFVAFKFWDIYVATATAIAATLAQVAWSWLRHRKVDKMLWVSLAIIIVFGGATLLLKNETFIKWKPTVLYWSFGFALLAAKMFFGKNLIRAAMEKSVTLPDAVWNRLNLSWMAFFTVMGALNLYVAFNYSTDIWVNFKLFGGIGLMLVFVLIQGAALSRYMESGETK
jgi:intracellular septation protein